VRIVFFGSGDFGLPTLKKLLDSRHEVVCVVTQPDRKKGRGWNVQPTLYKAFMEQAAPGIEVFQPEKVSDQELADDLRKFEADVFIVIDYGQFLSKEVLSIPNKYCINLHPSLLPKYRGASPVNRVIMDGEKITGNTVIKMNERMDAGEIILQDATPVLKDEDAVLLSSRLADMGAVLVMKALDLVEKGEERPAAQDEKAATYAKKLLKEDGIIDWAKSSEEILRKVRGTRSWPGAFTALDGKMLKIHRARPSEYIFPDSKPGTIVDEKKVIVRCGDGFLKIDELQLEGKRTMSSDEFIRGYELEKGTILG
jgi:methionyl-tRNA formyltransferase